MPASISVAMATYNGSAFIVEQLASVLRQSQLPAEIVVCDDRSSDDTVRLVEDVAASSPVPIRVAVNEERLGWRGNFMRAASLCESDVIAFCDQDDVWDPRKLERLAEAFEDAGTLVVFHDATIVGGGLEPIGPFRQGDDEPHRAAPLQRRPWRDVYGFTIAFRSDLLALWAHWPSSLDKSVNRQRAAHDQWLHFLGSSLGTTVHLTQPLAFYRQHGGNAVSAKDALRRPSRLQVLLAYRDAVTLRLRVLDNRIGILGEIAREGGAFAGEAARALAVHRAYRTRLAAQVTVHDSDELLLRLRAFAVLVVRGSYSSGFWALGRRAALDDAVAAVLGPTGLARLRRRRSGMAERQSQSP